jgi:hypothetical protein
MFIIFIDIKINWNFVYLVLIDFKININKFCVLNVCVYKWIIIDNNV